MPQIPANTAHTIVQADRYAIEREAAREIPGRGRDGAVEDRGRIGRTHAQRALVRDAAGAHGQRIADHQLPGDRRILLHGQASDLGRGRFDDAGPHTGDLQDGYMVRRIIRRIDIIPAYKDRDREQSGRRSLHRDRVRWIGYVEDRDRVISRVRDIGIAPAYRDRIRASANDRRCDRDEAHRVRDIQDRHGVAGPIPRIRDIGVATADENGFRASADRGRRQHDRVCRVRYIQDIHAVIREIRDIGIFAFHIDGIRSVADRRR